MTNFRRLVCCKNCLFYREVKSDGSLISRCCRDQPDDIGRRPPTDRNFMCIRFTHKDTFDNYIDACERAKRSDKT